MKRVFLFYVLPALCGVFIASVVFSEKESPTTEELLYKLVDKQEVLIGIQDSIIKAQRVKLNWIEQHLK